jgi:hypothetical protein
MYYIYDSMDLQFDYACKLTQGNIFVIKLVLVLPVATATVERCFSGMKIVKNKFV